MSSTVFLPSQEPCVCTACTTQGKTTKKARRRAPNGLSLAEAKVWRRRRASARELRRIHELQTAFEVLRQVVPVAPNEDKPSKVTVLRQAADYVKLLRDMLGQDGNCNTTRPRAVSTCSDNSYGGRIDSCSSASSSLVTDVREHAICLPVNVLPPTTYTPVATQQDEGPSYSLVSHAQSFARSCCLAPKIHPLQVSFTDEQKQLMSIQRNSLYTPCEYCRKTTLSGKTTIARKTIRFVYQTS